MYKVLFYKNKAGDSLVEDCIKSLPLNARAKIARQIEYLKMFGLTSANPNLRKLTGTMLWESRIIGGDSIRIVCAVYVKNVIFILNIFKKKSNKTPTREITLALKRLRDIDF